MKLTFPGARRIFPKIDHVLCHKKVSTNFKRLIIFSVFLCHNGIKLEISNKRINRKVQKHGIKYTLLNNLWVKDKINRNCKIC